jgi:hypothetical protein
MIHELLPLVQHYNRSRDRMLRRSPSLQNPLSLLEAFLLDSILRYWVISFAFAPLLYAAGKFLPVAFIFFVLSFALMVPTFLGCVRALAEAPKSAYLQLPRLCLPYAIFVVISMNLAVLCGYAAGYGLRWVLYSVFDRGQPLYLPNTLYSFFDKSPLALPLAGQAEGAVIAVTLMMFLSWLVVVWKKRAYGHVAGVSLIVAALASKQALEPVKSVLLEFGSQLTITPAIVVALAVPAIAALVFSSLGHSAGTQKCNACHEDELPDHAGYCSSCGVALEGTPLPGASTSTEAPSGV